MAGILASRIDNGNSTVWVYDTKPSDNGLSAGSQVGDLVYETTGTHLWVIKADHSAQALSA